MKRFRGLLLVLLSLALVLCPACLAEEAEGAPLAVDTDALIERGECFAGLAPGASLEEALAAGLRLPEEPDHTDAIGQIESRTFLLDAEQKVVFGELPVLASWFQFMNDHLVDISLTLEEELPQEEITALLTGLFGEPTDPARINEGTGLGSVQWLLETGGQPVTVQASLAQRENGVCCVGINVTYRDLIAAIRDAK